MPNQRDLFEFLHGGRRLAVSVTHHGKFRTYLGSINGVLAVTAPAKGDLLRALIQLARHYPKLSFTLSSRDVVRAGESG